MMLVEVHICRDYRRGLGARSKVQFSFQRRCPLPPEVTIRGEAVRLSSYWGKRRNPPRYWRSAYTANSAPCAMVIHIEIRQRDTANHSQPLSLRSASW